MQDISMMKEEADASPLDQFEAASTSPSPVPSSPEKASSPAVASAESPVKAPATTSAPASSGATSLPSTNPINSFPYMPTSFPFPPNAAAAFPLAASAAAAAAAAFYHENSKHFFQDRKMPFPGPPTSSAINYSDLLPPLPKLRKPNEPVRDRMNRTPPTISDIPNPFHNLPKPPMMGDKVLPWRFPHPLVGGADPLAVLRHQAMMSGAGMSSAGNFPASHGAQENSWNNERIRLQHEVMALKNKMLHMSHNLGVILADQVLTSEAAARINTILSSSDLSFLADDIIVELEKKVKNVIYKVIHGFLTANRPSLGEDGGEEREAAQRPNLKRKMSPMPYNLNSEDVKFGSANSSPVGLSNGFPSSFCRDRVCGPRTKVTEEGSCTGLSLASAVGSTDNLTANHLRKAKLMFFFQRYPTSSTLRQYFTDVKFNRHNNAQLIKWFSNFREYYYIQIEKYAREVVSKVSAERQSTSNPVEVLASSQALLQLDESSELFKNLNLHYNKSTTFKPPESFLTCVRMTVRQFAATILVGGHSDPAWKKHIYKIISKLDTTIPEAFKTHHLVDNFQCN